MIRRLKRLSDQDRDALDRVLAAGLFALMASDLAFSDHHGPLLVEILLVALISLALPWRRKRPLLTTAVSVAAAVTLFIGFVGPNRATAVTFSILVVGYSTGVHLELRRSLVGFALAVGGIAAVCIVRTPGDVAFPVIFFGIVPWAVGRVIRGQTALARELTEKAEREQIAREEEEARAATAERARVARELHDVLAHNLSVMVIQASAARRVAEKDPDAAIEAAELISRTGREALSELRYLFGPVRREGESPGTYQGDALGASPGLANLEQLASRAHRAGVPVQVLVEGQPVPLSPGADLAAYRVVQEALTNTLKHAGGASATVTVRYEPGDVTIEVLDNGVSVSPNGDIGAGGGHGLVGMRERVALYGGELEVGRRNGSGFVVRARFPMREASALSAGGLRA